MISSKQIKVGRSAANLSQGQLAKLAGTTQSYVSKLEEDKVDNPTSNTLRDIKSALESKGIKFTENGISWPQSNSYSIEGENWWAKVLDDVQETLINSKNKECIFVCSDDSKSPPNIVEKHRELRASGITFRNLVEQGNTYLMGELDEYRLIPSEFFLNNVTLIYGDKIAVCAEDNTKAIVTQDLALSKSWCNLIDLLWSLLQKPTESKANETF